MKRLSTLLCLALSLLSTSQAFSQSPLIPELGISQDETISFLENSGYLAYSQESEAIINVVRGSNTLEYRFEPNFGLSQVVLFQNLDSKKQAHERYKYIVQEFIVTCFRNVSSPVIETYSDHGELSTTFTIENERTEIMLLKTGKKSNRLKIVKSDINAIGNTASTSVLNIFGN